MSRGLIKAGLLRLQVSLDAATEETYNKIRLGGDFKKTLDNIDTFLRIRTELGSELPTLRVNFVKTPENAHELSQFIKMWESKADFIGIQDLLGIVDIFDKSKKEGYQSRIEQFKCAQPYQHITVRSNGHILPCCSFFGPDTPIALLKHNIEGVNLNGDDGILVSEKTKASVASLMVRSIEEAWLSDEMNYFREIHRNGEYWKNPVCKKCVESTSHYDETQ